MNSIIEQAEGLFDFSQDMDIALLDKVVTWMYTSDGLDQQLAQNILTALKAHPDAWTKVDSILKISEIQQTRYFALQILEDVIKFRWRTLPGIQCEGIKHFITDLIIKTSSTSKISVEMKVFLNKLNIILVQILKKEWPKNWPNFIGELTSSSHSCESLCQNNMIILKLMSEEIFDFSSEQMIQIKAKYLKDTMCSEFSNIFELCQYVMENSQNSSLVLATLETLHKFLNWIPIGYIFETKLINTLIFKFLNAPMLRNITLKCLSEIASINAPIHEEMFIVLFRRTMAQLSQIIPERTSIKDAYENGQDDIQNFIHDLSLFLSSFLKVHGKLVETRAELEETLMKSVHLLVQISKVEELEIFKICLEYWKILAAELYEEKSYLIDSHLQNFDATTSARHQFYQPFLSEVRNIIVGRMVKPEEVIVVEDEQGEVMREFMKDTDSIELYNNMRETLVYLTHLDRDDTKRIFMIKMCDQMKETEWSRKKLNTLCWAIGSVSGAMKEEDESKFFVTVIQNLLELFKQKIGNNKIIVASNLLYVIGQYPIFLETHWEFFKVLIDKLCDFMHANHECLQEMACDTFYKIVQRCAKHLIQDKPVEMNSFVENILSNIELIISDLQPQQIYTFYEAIGFIIDMQPNEAIKENQICLYMHFPNETWNNIISKATLNRDVLKDLEKVKQLIIILKTNGRACKSLGSSYLNQLGHIYLDMLNVYAIMSEYIGVAIAIEGETVMKQSLIRSMSTVRKQILKLISSWIKCSDNPLIVLNNFLPPLLEIVLLNYRLCGIPIAREPDVLSTMTIIVSQLGETISSEIPKIFESVFECTLSMINSDFEVFPEYRVKIFLFIQASVKSCFSTILNMPNFKKILDSIIWAIRHTVRTISDIGLEILYQLFQSILKVGADRQKFYQMYYMEILEHLFSVTIDTSHTACLTMQSTILASMFELVETSKIFLPLNQAQQTVSGQSNINFVKEYLATLLKGAFPYLKESQIKITVQGFFNLYLDIPAFKEHLRDFLVQIKEFAGGADDSDLFIEERESLLRQAEEMKRNMQSLSSGDLCSLDMESLTLN